MRILIIEDDPSIQMLLKLSLQVEGYDVTVAGTVREGTEQLHLTPYNLILLDLMLPDQSGFQFLQTLQKQYPQIPVIVLTAKNAMNDKILGFQLGADDYMTKPFETRELVERIKAVMRRIKTPAVNNVVVIGNIEIDYDERMLKLDGKSIKTTTKEFDFMWLLCTNPKKVFTREQLLDAVWGYDYYGPTRSVDMMVNRLREKLKPYENIVATVHGKGYKLEVSDEA